MFPRTGPEAHSGFERFAKSLLTKKQQPENANAHVSLMAGRLIASNPISKEMEIELGDLSTIGPVTFDDTVSGVAEFTAEARTDPQTGEWVNAAARFGPMPEYVIYSVEPTEAHRQPGGQVARRLIGRVPTPAGSNVCFMHTYGLTENYAIVFHIPLELDMATIVESELCYIAYDEASRPHVSCEVPYTWMPHDRPTMAYLVERATGKVSELSLPAFYYSHILNAFEVKSNGNSGGISIVVDLCGARDAPPPGWSDASLYRTLDDWRIKCGQLRRLRLDFGTGEHDISVAEHLRVDSLYVNPSHVGRKHRYSYGEHVEVQPGGKQTLRLIKVDHDDIDATRLWAEQNLTTEEPSSPMFVPRPESKDEDDGVVLSYVRDHSSGNTCVVVLDAATLHEAARIYLPPDAFVPHLVHSVWVPAH